MEFLLVFLGGGIGSTLRYWLSLLFEKEQTHYCTLGINIVACFLIGVLFGLILYKSNFNKHLSALLITGFCGGFSTLSAYSLDVINLCRSGNYFQAAFYMSATIMFCLIVTVIGLLLVKSF